MAGTAYVVVGLTAVALRYQVEPPARAAKFGNRRASIPPRSSSSDVSGSSSSTSTTTGGWDPPEAAAPAGPEPAECRTTAEEAEPNTKMVTKTNGPTAANRSNCRGTAYRR